MSFTGDGEEGKGMFSFLGDGDEGRGMLAVGGDSDDGAATSVSEDCGNGISALAGGEDGNGTSTALLSSIVSSGVWISVGCDILACEFVDILPRLRLFSELTTESTSMLVASISLSGFVVTLSSGFGAGFFSATKISIGGDFGLDAARCLIKSFSGGRDAAPAGRRSAFANLGFSVMSAWLVSSSERDGGRLATSSTGTLVAATGRRTVVGDFSRATAVFGLDRCSCFCAEGSNVPIK